MAIVPPSRRLRSPVVLSLVIILFLGALVTSAVAMDSHAKPKGLLTTTTTRQNSYPTKDLPPSHDNDAGKARVLDATADNDTDAWQRG